MTKPAKDFSTAATTTSTGAALDDPSLIFISTPYLQNHQLPTKLQSSFFDLNAKFNHTMQSAQRIFAPDSPSLIFSTTSGGIQTCQFIADEYLSDVLTATQEALSDLFSLETLLTKHAISQLKARLEDKIAFNQKFSSYQEGGGGILSQSIDLNILLGGKKGAQEAALISKPKEASDKDGMASGNIQSLDLKKMTFLQSMRASVHGLEDMNCRPIIFAEFLQNLLHVSHDDQERITYKVREALLQKKAQEGAQTQRSSSSGIEVRELVGLVAVIAQQH